MGRLRRGGVLGGLALGAALALCVAVSAGPTFTWLDAARALAFIAVVQVLPGALIWRCVRPVEGWLLEDLAFGLAIGVGLAVPAQALGGVSGSRWPGIALPLAAAALVLVLPRTRARVLRAHWTPAPWWFGTAVAASSLVALPQLMGFVKRFGVDWTPGTVVPQVDQSFHMAVTAQLLHRGPGEWPMVAGEGLGYHWFGHAWLAQICAGTGLQVDEVTLRVAALIMPIAVATATAALALRLSGSFGVGAVAAGIVTVGGTFNAWRTSGLGIARLPVNPESFTLGVGAVVLLATTALLAMRWRRQAGPGSIVLLAGLTVIATGTKGSTTPLLVAGTAIAAVLLVRRRHLAKIVLLDLVVMGLALLVTLRVVFQGSAGALTVDPEAAARSTFLVQATGATASSVAIGLSVAVMLIAGLSRAGMGFALLARRSDTDGRRDPVTWLLLGASAAGAGAPAVFVQPGSSQYYFTLSALPLAAVAAALGGAAAWRLLGRRAATRVVLVGLLAGVAVHLIPVTVLGTLSGAGLGRAVGVLGIAAALTAAAAAISAGAVDPSHRVRAAILVIPVVVLASGMTATARSIARVPPDPPVLAATSPSAVTDGQVRTARFIRDHSRRSDLVMSNRHCTTPRPTTCDSRRFSVAAYAERQMLLEGWGYTPTISRLAPEGRTSLTHPYWNPERLRWNDDFYVTPTAATAKSLWDSGVRWIYVDHLVSKHDLRPFAVQRYTAGDGKSSAWQLLPPRQ